MTSPETLKGRFNSASNGWLGPTHASAPPTLETGGSPPHDGAMEARIAKLEAVIPTLATKVDVEGVRTDIHKMDASIKTWMIATIITLFLGFAGLFFTMSTSINGALERAAKAQNVAPAAAAPQLAPIVIQMPVAPPTPTAQTP